MPVTFLPRQKSGRTGARSSAKSSGKGGGKSNAGRGSGGKPSSGTRRRLDRLFSRRDLILRLCLVAAACAATVAVVRGWEPPVRHRLGDFAPDGIAARVPFAVVDRLRTERERERNAAAVRPIFRNAPERLTPLADQFRRELADLAARERLELVPRQTRASFGLVVAQPAAPATGEGAVPPVPVGEPPTADELRDSQDEFRLVRTALMSQPSPGDNPRPGSPERVDAATGELSRVLTRLGELGVLDETALAPSGVGPDRTVRILHPDGRAEAQLASTRLIDPLVRQSDELDPVWAELTGLQAIRPLVERWLVRHVKPTLGYAADLTDAARAAARTATPTARTEFAAGEQLVPPGDTVDADALDLLTAEHAALVARLTPAGRLLRCAAVGLMLAVAAVLIGWLLRRTGSTLPDRPVRLGIFLAGLVAAVALGRWLSFDPWRAEVIPVLACAMVFTVAYDQWLGALTAFVLAAVVVFTTTGDLDEFITLMSVCVAGVLPLTTVAGRSTVIKVGLLAGLIHLAVSGGLGLLERQPLGAGADVIPVITDSLRGAGWCLLAGYLVAGSLPFVENLFGVVTDISLLEMSDVSHPLLQELVRRAPGTYNHSISVATIGETAADAIGANGLLLRTAAYFHDVGKMLKPHYFVEEPDREGPRPARPARPGDEHPDHHRPRQGRGGPGPAARPAGADHRLHRAAPRHHAGGLLFPRGGQAGRAGAGPRGGRRGGRFPLPRPQAAE